MSACYIIPGVNTPEIRETLRIHKNSIDLELYVQQILEIISSLSKYMPLGVLIIIL
jgi:hypothetical protein